MTNPNLLLLDEPFEGLAPIVVEELTAAIRQMIAERVNALSCIAVRRRSFLPII